MHQPWSVHDAATARDAHVSHRYSAPSAGDRPCRRGTTYLQFNCCSCPYLFMVQRRRPPLPARASDRRSESCRLIRVRPVRVNAFELQSGRQTAFCLPWKRRRYKISESNTSESYPK